MKKTFFLMLFVTTTLIASILKSSTIYSLELKAEGVTQLESILTNDPMMRGAISGLSVRSASTGEILYSLNGETSLTPASSLKLFTAIAALTILGSDYTFNTKIKTDGKWEKKGVLKGNVYILGGGDPTLTIKDIKMMAKQLRQKGIKKIDGDVIGDDSRYDTVRYSVDLPWTDETAYYGAQISALTASPDEDFDAGTIQIQITPSQKDIEPKITLIPATDYVTIQNKAKTTDAESEETINITRVHGKNEVIIEGSIPEDKNMIKEWISIWNPTKYTLALFQKEFAQQGIHITGKCYSDITPTKTQNLVLHESEALSEILIPFLKLSNNTIAEMLVKEMGKVTHNQGTWEKGLETEINTLDQLGIDVNNTVLRDGSGLSHINTTQVNTITQLLYKAQSKEWFSQLYKALPVSGEEDKLTGGTLRKRMKNSPLKQKVVAKTGTLTNVSSLSGFLETKSGEVVIFSIILNHMDDEEKGKIIEEKILSVLQNWLE
ncbi:D-alanyl-D-alanine carboxypeptidase/D-alanyl-D-alanine-endopeptidase [Metabacillus niabensis]|uniref:D-alanyl-D-alanine carboxypeptidase/D-alanyl-D-alanine endopeptidase n=1 Tax=Metabacillus niabensis TaxID=324854 RepID=UPI001CFABFC2|nr:D-alanyl-D-alanine carboxypeptidase/D-alanyl-D-alanine-endopeptidase [Metabacillus niabensis]